MILTITFNLYTRKTYLLYLTTLISLLSLVLSGCTPLASPTGTTTTEGNGPHTASMTGAQLARVQHIIRGMTVEQKLGQLIMVEYLGNNYQESGLKSMIAQHFVGGYLYQPVNHNFDAPLDTVASVHAFAQQANADASVPLLIAVDQEGGLVSKLAGFFGPAPSAAALAASGNSTTARQQGAQTAQWMKEMGINVDLAPVVDVQSINPPAQPLLQSRTFGKDARTVSTYASAFLDGLQNNHISGCLKHFPGLGSFTAEQDPHDALYAINHTLADWQNIDLAPYKQLIGHNNPALIMSTDVKVPALDADLPAELSPKLINGTLRTDLGYQGVVITDGLYMKGITTTWTIPQAAVLALSAGNDIVEGPYTSDQVTAVIAALKTALQDGRLSITRIDQSVQRILALKMYYGLLK